jgi:beta-galactosidase GanA
VVWQAFRHLVCSQGRTGTLDKLNAAWWDALLEHPLFPDWEEINLHRLETHGLTAVDWRRS